MIERIGREIRDWIISTVTGAEVALGLPDDDARNTRIGLYLMDLSQENRARVGRIPPFEISLRYLVTARSPRAEEAQRVIGELILAALRKPEKEPPEFEALVEPLPVEAWAALGAPPQPSFFLRAPLRIERPQPAAPLARAPVALHPSPMRALSGAVYASDGTPVMGARVELLSLGIATRTNEQGRFRFAGVPANSRLRLSVDAKGQKREIDCSGAVAAGGDEPLEIRLRILED